MKKIIVASLAIIVILAVGVLAWWLPGWAEERAWSRKALAAYRGVLSLTLFRSRMRQLNRLPSLQPRSGRSMIFLKTGWN